MHGEIYTTHNSFASFRRSPVHSSRQTVKLRRIKEYPRIPVTKTWVSPRDNLIVHSRMRKRVKENGEWQPVSSYSVWHLRFIPSWDYNKSFKSQHCQILAFPMKCQWSSSIRYSLRLRGNTQTDTHTQTDCYNPPPTLGLIIIIVDVLQLLCFKALKVDWVQ